MKNKKSDRSRNRSDADFFRKLFENAPRHRPVADEDDTPFTRWLQSEEDVDQPIEEHHKEKMRKKFHKKMKDNQ